jgi:hypothetical protein
VKVIKEPKKEKILNANLGARWLNKLAKIFTYFKERSWWAWSGLELGDLNKKFHIYAR